MRNNTVSIAKAIGIILMVVGQSGCPKGLCQFIYLFHMPLFFLFLAIFLIQTPPIQKKHF